MRIFLQPSKQVALHQKAFLLVDAVVGTIIFALLSVAMLQAVSVFRMSVEKQELEFAKELEQKQSSFESFL